MRCYNGAWDSEAQALFRREDAIMAKIKKVEPEAHLCYFPVEGTHIVHVWGREIGPERSSRLAALEGCLVKLEAADGK